ncbi:MAG: rhomboid family intramembrane serine protease [Planctomycetota bacterium]|nr:rhomboid family intramembrane serine protease [Planctomycetota bacterium]
MRVVLPPITKGLLISWWLFWLLSLLTPDWVLPWGVALNSELLSSPSLLRILGVAVYSLFHADFLHLFLNSIVFASLAQILETSLTRTLFVRLLVMSSLVPAILWLLLGLFAPGPQVVVGASGLVYALFGASLCIYPGLPINLIFISSLLYLTIDLNY